MARIRYIKPEFFEDETVGALSVLARMLYIGLWCHLDRTGVAPLSPKVFKAKIFPFDDDVTAAKVAELVFELINCGRLSVFEHDGKKFIFCANFKKHQLFHKNEKAKYSFSEEYILAQCKHRTETVLVPFEHTKELVTGNGERVTGNGQLVTGNGSHGPSKDGAAPKEKPDTRSFIVAYCEAYKTRYKTNPLVPDDQLGIVRSIVKAAGNARAPDYAREYLSMTDGWFLTKRHDLATLKANLNAVKIRLETGQTISRKEASIADSQDFHKNQMRRLTGGGAA